MSLATGAVQVATPVVAVPVPLTVIFAGQPVKVGGVTSFVQGFVTQISSTNKQPVAPVLLAINAKLLAVAGFVNVKLIAP